MAVSYLTFCHWCLLKEEWSVRHVAYTYNFQCLGTEFKVSPSYMSSSKAAS